MKPLDGGFVNMSHRRHGVSPEPFPEIRDLSRKKGVSGGNCLAVVTPFLGIVTFGSVLSTEFPGMMNAADLAPSTEGFVGNSRGSK